MILMVGSITHASDNRSAPNVFSSGSTISSSQMNENFNFLASEIRERDVNCNNGETISDAINEGYNSLTIYGTCDGGVVAYMFDPVIYGVSFNQMLNKPVSYLIIKGGEANRAAVIQNTAALMESGAMQKSFLELSNLTFNDSLNANAGSVILLNEVNYEVTNIINVSNGDDPEYGRLTSYDNSFIDIKDSIIKAEVKASDGSVINIQDTTINPTEQVDRVVNIKRNSVLKTDRTTLNGRIDFSTGAVWYDYKSTVNCTTDYSCISVRASKIDVEDTRLNLISNSGSAFYGKSSYMNFYTPVVDCVSEYSCFDFQDSYLDINLSNNYEGKFEVTSNNGDSFNLRVSTINLRDATVDCSSSYACFNLTKSELFTENVNLNITSGINGVYASVGSFVEFNSNTSLTCPENTSGSSYKEGCIKTSNNSNLRINDSSISSNNSWALESQWGSLIQCNNCNLSRLDGGYFVHLNANSGLEIGSGSNNVTVECGMNSFYANHSGIQISASDSCTEF